MRIYLKKQKTLDRKNYKKEVTNRVTTIGAQIIHQNRY